MHDNTAIEKAIAIHTKTYGTEPTSISYAPGRIEVLGNHTDYNEGTVLSAAINMGHCFCISASDKPGVRVTAGDIRATTSFDPSDGSRMDRKVQWANYVKGVMHLLRKKDVIIDNVDCTFYGTIPMGAGLSSSAALEVSTAYATLQHLGVEMDKMTIAKIAQKAEHDFAGCNCGLLDQFSSIFGADHGLIHSDFRNLKTYSVDLPDDVVFLVINPHIRHSLPYSPYNARRKSCEKAAKELDILLDKEVFALRDVTLEEFKATYDKIDPEAAMRATHIICEITRVEKGVKLLAEGKIKEFGQYLYDSHETSRNAFENSCSELDIVVDAAKAVGALGARLTGGGWGGSVLVLAYESEADAISDKIAEMCKADGITTTTKTIVPSEGASNIESPIGVLA